MPTVREVMTPRPTAISQTASLDAAVELLMELDVRHLPVVNEAHELVGMLSDRDLRRPNVPVSDADRAALYRAPVSSLMSANVISVAPDDELASAIEVMLEQRVGALPVIDPEGRLVGLLSYVDALRAYHRDLTGATT